jgi:methionyl-tRNA formyltransferase
MGTPGFAVPALRALAGAGHEIASVYCQPPRPSGRGQGVRRSPVHEAADAMGLPVRTPASLKRDPAAQAAFAELGLDVAVVAAYGLLLPQSMLESPRRGCLNIHASLLPRWRGAAPIQAALLAGDAETGVTIMRMEAGLDTGPMLLSGVLPITDVTTAASLHDDLAGLGAALVLRALAENPAPVPQPAEGVTYAAKLTREDGRLDWALDATLLARRVRALNPWPGTFATLGGETLKIHAAHAEAGSGPPGTVLDESFLVATGNGALRLTRIQAPGRAPMAADAFLRGRRLPAGTLLQ